MKIKVAITLAIIAIILFSASVFAVNTYSQIKTETMPEIQSETFESYATNIANSLINGTGIEIPDEMLTYIVQSKTNKDLVCLITDDDKFEIVIRETFEYVGEVDVTMIFEFEDYSNDTLNIEIEEVYIGSLKLPDNFTEDIFDFVDFSADDIYNDSENLYIEIGTYDIEFLGLTVAVGVRNVSLESSKMLVEFYTDANISNFFG